MKSVIIIGMGLSPADLTSAHLKLIESADILVGGKRHLEFFNNLSTEKKEIGRNLKEVIEFIKNRAEEKSVVVLASGDPLFFGIASLLIKSLGAENVSVYPNITSVAAAFSRIKEPWQDARVISIHGRFDEQEFSDAVLNADKIAVLTDPVKNPAWIADFLLKKGLMDFKFCVLEQLGTDTEHIGWYELEEAAGKAFSEPNIVVLMRMSSPRGEPNLHIGMPEEAYQHQEGLITKAEVRAVTLSKLRLCSPNHILWDLGSGSGSVSIEAALFIKNGQIIAVEQRADRIAQIENNKRQFGIKNLTIIQAKLPEGLENLPEPDRIFIGGGGKHLKNIIVSAAAYLKPGDIIVVNTVLIQNIETVLAALKQTGFKTDIIQMQVSRSRDMPWGQRLEAQNPVWIISGMKEVGSEK